MKEKNVLISIIVPVYKVEKYLHRCIDSILNQTYKNLEIILVDDGSPDECPQICDGYAKKDRRIKVIHKKNAGVSEARNTGIKEANGDFICFVDSDDYLAKNYVSELISEQLRSGSDVVFCSYFYDANGKIITPTEDLKQLVESKKIELFLSEPNNVMGSICRILVKKEIFQKLSFCSDLKYCEDFYFVLNLFVYNYKMSYVNKCLYYYVCNPNSITQKYTKNTTKYYADAIIKCIELLENRVDKKLINRMYFGIYFMAVMQFMHTRDKNVLNEYKVYNTKENYKSFIFYNKCRSTRLKAFLCRHHLFSLYKLASKIKKAI